MSVWVLYFDDAPVAMEYQMDYEGNIFALRSDFDEAYRSFSPGSYLSWQMLIQLFRANGTTYFLGPGENEYKKKWAESYTPLQQFIFYGKSFRGRFLYFFENRIKTLVKKILYKLQNAIRNTP